MDFNRALTAFTIRAVRDLGGHDVHVVAASFWILTVTRSAPQPCVISCRQLCRLNVRSCAVEGTFIFRLFLGFCIIMIINLFILTNLMCFCYVYCCSYVFVMFMFFYYYYVYCYSYYYRYLFLFLSSLRGSLLLDFVCVLNLLVCYFVFCYYYCFVFVLSLFLICFICFIV